LAVQPKLPGSRTARQQPSSPAILDGLSQTRLTKLFVGLTMRLRCCCANRLLGQRPRPSTALGSRTGPSVGAGAAPLAGSGGAWRRTHAVTSLGSALRIQVGAGWSTTAVAQRARRDRALGRRLGRRRGARGVLRGRQLEASCVEVGWEGAATLLGVGAGAAGLRLVAARLRTARLVASLRIIGGACAALGRSGPGGGGETRAQRHEVAGATAGAGSACGRACGARASARGGGGGAGGAGGGAGRGIAGSGRAAASSCRGSGRSRTSAGHRIAGRRVVRTRTSRGAEARGDSQGEHYDARRSDHNSSQS